jgi:phosphotransferase system HPr (HPr) family protein
MPEITVVVSRADALHARPAAQVVRVVGAHRADVWLGRADGPEPAAEGRSITALLALGIGRGEAVRVRATGPDADAALAAIRAILEDDAAAPGTAP